MPEQALLSLYAHNEPSPAVVIADQEPHYCWFCYDQHLGFGDERDAGHEQGDRQQIRFFDWFWQSR